jgi:zinc protease
MLFQGSQNVGDDMHFKYVSEAGGTLNGTTNTDRTVYFETLPSNQLEVALWLESDRMGFLLPALTQKTLDNQIDVVKNERRQNYENRPYGQDRARSSAALYPKDIRTRGSRSDRTRISRSAKLEDVKAFFSRWYAPNNATLVVAGDVNPAEVRVLARALLRPDSARPAVDRPAPRPVTLDAVKRIVREDRVRCRSSRSRGRPRPWAATTKRALDMLARDPGREQRRGR